MGTAQAAQTPPLIQPSLCVNSPSPGQRRCRPQLVSPLPVMSQPADPIPARIFTIRGHRVILDSDLARLYGVPTFRLNESAKRNRDKFPEDFRFQLTREELAHLRSRSATSSLEPAAHEQPDLVSSQIAMTSKKRARRYLPWGPSRGSGRGAWGRTPNSSQRQLAVPVLVQSLETRRPRSPIPALRALCALRV